MKSSLLNALAGASTATALVIRGTLRCAISDELTSPILIASSPSLFSLILAVSTGAFVGLAGGRWLERRGAPDVLRPLLWPGLTVLAYIPRILDVAPLLAAFSGPFLDLLLIGCAAATLWRAGNKFGVHLSPTANRVAVVAFAAYLVVGHRMQDRVGLSGDEPHYLLMAYSLLHDGDLAVANNYADGDFREFYRGKIMPHLAWGFPYSVHGAGLPIILLPGFAILGLWGVLVTEALMGSFLVREVYRTAEILTDDRQSALVAAVGFGATAPALFQCVSAYPELPVALLTTAGIRRLVAPSLPGATAAFLWGLSFSLLAFFHVKFLPLTAVLALGAFAAWRERRWMVVSGGAVGLASIIIFFAVALDLNMLLMEFRRQHVFWNIIPSGLAGIFFDQEFGLLPASPFYIVAIAGLGRVCRQHLHAGLLAFGALGAVAVPAAAHPAWWAGSSPPARYIFAALPIVAVASAFVWSAKADFRARRWSQSFLLISLCLSGFMAFGPGQPLYLNRRDGTGRLWESLGASWDLTHYLPSLLREEPYLITVVVGGAIAILVAIGVQFSGHRIRLPSLALSIIVGAWLIDFFAIGMPPEGIRARWNVDLLRELPGREKQRFFLLPSATRLSYLEVVAMVDLTLSTARVPIAEDAEEPHWESRPIYLPAGQYALEGDLREELSICNGERCFASTERGGQFDVRVDLARFHVRAKTAPSGIRIKILNLGSTAFVANCSLRLPSGARFHSLDENAFSEAKGFWVGARSEARFVLEAAPDSQIISLANGGRENWVEVVIGEKRLQFSLRPWAIKYLEVPMEDDIALLVARSASGFRPEDFDSRKGDRRDLGVFLSSRPR